MKKIFFLLLVITASYSYSQNGVVKSYYPDRTIKSELSYVNDILDGPALSYHENGKLKEEKNYSRGILNGWIRSYYSSGILKEEYFVKNGILDGDKKQYSERGQLLNIISYDNGLAINRQYFENQDEIIRALISEGEAWLTADLRKAQASSQDVYDQLRAIAQTYWTFASNHRELHKLIFNVGGHRKVFAVISSSYRVYMETLRRGVKEGKIKFSLRNYHGIARTMWAWIYGLIVLELTGMLQRRKEDSDPVAEGMNYFARLLKEGE